MIESPDSTAVPAAQDPVPLLLGRVYAESPTPLKRRLLEHLLQPLGLLSLATVCNGAFATLALNPEGAIHSELTHSVDADQVQVLASYVQQVNWHAVTNLSQLIATSPMLQGSMAASALVALLIKRSREQPRPDAREHEDFEP